MAKTVGLQYAADAAEKAGDTKTQDVKKMQYPYATDSKGYTDTSLYPSKDRQQRYRTQDKAATNAKRSTKRSSK